MQLLRNPYSSLGDFVDLEQKERVRQLQDLDDPSLTSLASIDPEQKELQCSDAETAQTEEDCEDSLLKTLPCHHLTDHLANAAAKKITEENKL